jgi:hypothetical protein
MSRMCKEESQYLKKTALDLFLKCGLIVWGKDNELFEK